MHLGSLIRLHRKEKKLTLKAVAEIASVSEGFLSQVENNVNSPSVETLMRICAAIGIDAGKLISQVSKQEKTVVIRRSEWDDIDRSDLSHTGFVTRRFFPPEYRSVIDSAVLVIEPGTTIPVRRNIKNGQELLTVLKGQVDLLIRDDHYTLEEGDAVHYWADPVNQTITNISSSTSFVLWVGTL